MSVDLDQDLMDDDFASEMLADFLDESELYLDDLNEKLLEIDELLKQEEDEEAGINVDLEMLNAMFRDAHSLKGLSAMLRLNDINCLTHKIENVFDAARNDSLSVSRQVVDVILASVDRLTEMIEQLSQDNPETVEYEGIVESLTALMEGPSQPAEPDVEPSASQGAECQADEDQTEAAETDYKQQCEEFEKLSDDENIPEKYLTFFIGESEESLLELTDILEQGTEFDLAGLLAIIHRVKGSAATIGLNRTARLAHFMEDLIQDLRDKNQQPGESVVEAFVFAIDRLFDFVHALEKNQPEPDRFAEAYEKLLRARDSVSDAVTNSDPVEESESKADPGSSPTVEAKSEVVNATEEKQDAKDSTNIESAHAEFVDSLDLSQFTNRIAVCTIEFDSQLNLPGMKARLVLDRFEDSGHLIQCLPAAGQLDDVMELRFCSFALETEEETKQMDLKLKADGVLTTKVTEYPSESQPKQETSSQPVAPKDAPVESKAPKNTKQQTPAKQPEANKSSAMELAKSDRPIETIRVDIDRLDHLMNQAGQLVINKARFSRIGEQFKSIGNRKHTLHSLSNASNLLDKIDRYAETIHSSEQSALTVSIQSHLHELRSELDSVRNDVFQLKNVRTLVNDLGEAVHQLDRVAEGIQKSVMDTRMVPIGPLFSRFKRVVRDYTKGCGKDIRLVIRGDKTELDKRMIDELGDPLIHMVRNSADHGIETPEERQALGKPIQGTITLDAFHRGNQVFVEVKDDGRGLDPNRLKQKAVSKGVITAEEAERLTHQQAFQLIWEPGFSTAEKVTEISGRGMGMDIVHSKLEKLNGTVEIDSQLQKGTTITIKLPLTMAILPSLLTVIDEEVFAIPVESVLEIVQVNAEQFSTVHRARTALIRGRVVSVVELGEVLHFEGRSLTEENRNADATLVIIGNKGNEIGLVVDDLIGEEDIVIKSLAENYRNVTGFAGASILGDGRVSLILDVSAIIDLSCNSMAL